jgi:hypothetical protein
VGKLFYFQGSLKVSLRRPKNDFRFWEESAGLPVAVMQVPLQDGQKASAPPLIRGMNRTHPWQKVWLHFWHSNRA